MALRICRALWKSPCQSIAIPCDAIRIASSAVRESETTSTRPGAGLPFAERHRAVMLAPASTQVTRAGCSTAAVCAGLGSLGIPTGAGVSVLIKVHSMRQRSRSATDDCGGNPRHRGRRPRIPDCHPAANRAWLMAAVAIQPALSGYRCVGAATRPPGHVNQYGSQDPCWSPEVYFSGIARCTRCRLGGHPVAGGSSATCAMLSKFDWRCNPSVRDLPNRPVNTGLIVE
jgi:hypothetical protein